MKIWDFKKIHAKAWPLGKTHGLEVQLDYWEDGSLFAIKLRRRGPEFDHAGLRFAVSLFRWEFHIEYYSIFHADHLESAHKHASNHRDEILASTQCGCFYCCNVFQPSDVSEWTDKNQTALCPKCGIDAVIGEQSRFPITRSYLKQMNQKWFAQQVSKNP